MLQCLMGSSALMSMDVVIQKGGRAQIHPCKLIVAQCLGEQINISFFRFLVITVTIPGDYNETLVPLLLIYREHET